ncbi:MFS transporter [Pseudonocardia halophobica]|nr:MFS transporter [Pseudonocardia halophobica]
MSTSLRTGPWTLVAASLGFGVVQLDVTAVNVAVEPIGRALGGGVAGGQWVVDAYTVTFAALILTAGALGDRLGARRLFAGGFVLFTLASVACGMAPGLGTLIAARAVQGIGAAVLVPCSLALVAHAHPAPAARARAVGIWAAGASVALSAGPLLGGLLVQVAGWRTLFLINVPLGIAGLLLTARRVRETPASGARGVDLSGQAAAATALAALAGATILGGAAGFAAPAVLCLYGLAVLAGIAFVVVETRTPAPMLPPALFRRPVFAAASAMGLLVNVAFYGLIFVIGLYLQQVLGRSPLVTGLAFAPTTVAVGFANLLAARLGGPHRTIVVGSALLAAGCLTVIATDAVVVGLAVAGFGLGLVVPAMTAALLGSVEPARSGVAAGTLNTARQAGSVLGVGLFGALAARGLHTGLHAALLISVAIAVAVAGLALPLRPKISDGRPPRVRSSRGRAVAARRRSAAG